MAEVGVMNVPVARKATPGIRPTPPGELKQGFDPEPGQ